MQKIDFGGDERDRTADLLLARQALSQLSYTPTIKELKIIKNKQNFTDCKDKLNINSLLKSIKYFLVGISGFEPETSSLSGTRSNQLSYMPISITTKMIFQKKSK
jgi:hypothetical protein